MHKYNDDMTENDILNHVDSIHFEEMLKAYGLSIDKFILHKRKIARTDVELLNKVLQKCSKEKGINISVCLMEIENKIPFEKIVTLLNESTMNMLKQELTKKHGLRIGGNSLLNFFRKG